MLAIFEKRPVRWLGYFLFMVITLLICLAVTFPDERIKEIVIVQAEKSLNAGKSRAKRDDKFWEVQITDMDLWWFSGVEFHNVVLKEKWSKERLERAEAEADSGAPPQKPLTIKIPRVAVRGSLLLSAINVGGAAIFEVDFSQVDGGVIDGTVIQRSDGIFIDATFDGLDMYKAALLESVTGVPGFGKIDGKMAVILDPKTRLPIDGTFDFKGQKLSMGPAEVKTDKLPSMAYLEVPRTSLGNLVFKAHIERKGKTPVFVFDDFSAKGLDMNMEIWGDVQLNQVMARSQSDVKLRLQFNEDFVKENSLGPILNIQTLRSGRNGEGWYGISMRGPLSRIKPKGDLKIARGPDKKTKTADDKEADAQPAANAPAARAPTPAPKVTNRRKREDDPEAEEAEDNMEEGEE